MTAYIHVTNGVVDYGPARLPKAWGNTSFGQNITQEALRTFGIYPVIEDKPTFDPNTQKLVRGTVYFDEQTERGVLPYTAVPLSQKELDYRSDEEDKAEIIADNMVKTLILAKPSQIEAYINNNVTNLANAKEVLIILAKAISAIGKHVFRN